MTESLNVSRETWDRLQAYVDLALQWQKAINLISPATITDIWWRHIADSAQLHALFPPDVSSVLDVGSGGGFPAIVLAILAEDAIDFTLVESDRRKGVFLREAARVAGLSRVNVLSQRIETLPSQTFDMVTARALAPVSQLLAWTAPYSQRFLFPKGETLATELAAVSSQAYKLECFQSITDEKAKIVRLEKL